MVLPQEGYLKLGVPTIRLLAVLLQQQLRGQRATRSVTPRVMLEAQQKESKGATVNCSLVQRLIMRPAGVAATAAAASWAVNPL